MIGCLPAGHFESVDGTRCNDEGSHVGIECFGLVVGWFVFVHFVTSLRYYI